MLNQSIKKVTPGGAETLISYDYFDASSGTGYQTYYAGMTGIASGALSNNVFFSNNLNTNALITTTTFAKYIDKDFDVLLNMPINVQGDAIVDVPMGFYHNGNSASPTADTFILARLRKYDGTTETEVALASSAIWTAGVAVASLFNYNMRTCKIRVPMTHYKSGEYLRLTIEAWAKEGQANNNQVIIYHDGANRSDMDGETFNNSLVSGASILKLQLPLKIDL